jgi:hypothetical protein
MKLAHNLSLLLMLTGGLTLLPLYALMVWTRATLYLPTVVQSSVAWESERILYLINSVIILSHSFRYIMVLIIPINDLSETSLRVHHTYAVMFNIYVINVKRGIL